jgi:hypothetical protein
VSSCLHAEVLRYGTQAWQVFFPVLKKRYCIIPTSLYLYSRRGKVLSHKLFKEAL